MYVYMCLFVSLYLQPSKRRNYKLFPFKQPTDLRGLTTRALRQSTRCLSQAFAPYHSFTPRLPLSISLALPLDECALISISAKRRARKNLTEAAVAQMQS